jgi:hypothetical protein
MTNTEPLAQSRASQSQRRSLFGIQSKKKSNFCVEMRRRRPGPARPVPQLDGALTSRADAV